MSAAEEFFARVHRVICASLQEIRLEFFRQVADQILRRGQVAKLVERATTTHDPFNAHLLTPPTSHHPRAHIMDIQTNVFQNVRMPGAALLQFPHEEKFCPTPAQEITERFDVFFSFSFGPELAENVASIVARLGERPKINVPVREDEPLD